MKLLDCFENEAFNELINFSFEEVRAAFNQFRYFVPSTSEEPCTNEVIQLKDKYSEELSKIEKYSNEKYQDLVQSGALISRYDEPQFMKTTLEIQIKRKMISILKRYFNKEMFQQNKLALSQESIFKEETVETPQELWVALNVHKDHIYSLLSIIGYYQRHHRYFLSEEDFLKICYEYSNQVYYLNKHLGMKHRFVNIFMGNQRIKSSKSDEEVDESFQSNKFVDVDKISLIMLLQPYLKNNTREIVKIIEIMMKNTSRRHGRKHSSSMAWPKTLEEVRVFIAECESKGIMKRL